jgi:hypothetical protein
MMSSLGLDLGVGNIPSNAAAVFGNIAMNGDEYVRCLTCGYGGCDIRVSGCGCTLHAVRGSRLGIILVRVATCKQRSYLYCWPVASLHDAQCLLASSVLSSR